MVLSVFFGGVEVVIISTHMSGQYSFWRSRCRIQIMHIFTQSSLREKDFCWVIAVLIHTVVTDCFCRNKRRRVQFLLCWVDGKTEEGALDVWLQLLPFVCLLTENKVRFTPTRTIQVCNPFWSFQAALWECGCFQIWSFIKHLCEMIS